MPTVKKVVAKKKLGQPTKQTPAIINEILQRIATGEPLEVICRSPHMPGVRAVHLWKSKDAILNAAFACARDQGFDAIAADCLEIADQTGRDTIIGDDGNARQDSEWIARSRLRVDTRLKLLAKWCPRRYGERIEVEQTVAAQLRIVMGGDV